MEVQKKIIPLISYLAFIILATVKKLISLSSCCLLSLEVEECWHLEAYEQVQKDHSPDKTSWLSVSCFWMWMMANDGEKPKTQSVAAILWQIATDFNQMSEMTQPQQHLEKCTAPTGVRHITTYASSLPHAWEPVLTTRCFFCAAYYLTTQRGSWSRHHPPPQSRHQPSIWTSEEGVNYFFCYLSFCLTC